MRDEIDDQLYARDGSGNAGLRFTHGLQATKTQMTLATNLELCIGPFI